MQGRPGLVRLIQLGKYQAAAPISPRGGHCTIPHSLAPWGPVPVTVIVPAAFKAASASRMGLSELYFSASQIALSVTPGCPVTAAGVFGKVATHSRTRFLRSSAADSFTAS